MELPETKIAPTRINPKTLLIYSSPKVGKTSIVSQLENCLIIDLEEGSDYISALKIKANSLKEFGEIGKEITKQKKPYKFVAIDTITKLEEWCEKEGTEMYKSSVQGKSFTGKSVLSLPNGAGYHWLRMAFSKYLNSINELAEHVIIIGHLRDKYISVEGKEVSAKDIDLTGKIRNITCAKVDAIGHLCRRTRIGADKNPIRDKDGNTIEDSYLSFATTETIVCGSRIPHLSGRTFLMGRIKDLETKEIEVDWGQIYVK